MSTAKLARRMWWVGILGWSLLVSAGIYWMLTDIVLIAGGLPVVILLTLLLGGAFLVALASAWFGWFSVITDRILQTSDRPGFRVTLVVALLGLILSPSILVLVLRSVSAEPSPFVFASGWIAVLVLLASCLGWLKRWTTEYSARS